MKNVINLVKNTKLVQKIFYSATDARSITARNNIIYSSLFRGLSMVIGLWMVPLSLGYLNPTKYGIWLTMTSIIVWFNFFDIGLGNGLRNRLGESLAKNDPVKARGYVSTTYAILTIIVVLVFLVFLVLNRFIDWYRILNVPETFDEDLGLLMMIIFFFFCLRFIFGLILTILNADQRLGLSGFVDLLTNIVSFVGVYIISKGFHESLVWLGSFLSFAPAFVLLVASLWLLNTDYKSISPSIKHVNFAHTRSLTELSFQFFLLQIIVLLVFFSNNIIISQLLNPAKVSEFNIVHKYFNIITTISVLILNPYWSAANEAYHKNDFGWLDKSARHLVRMWVAIAVLTLIMVFLSPYAYRYWVKDAVQISMRSSLLMGVYVALFAWHNTFVYMINGIGKIRLQILIYIFVGLACVPLSYFFIKVLGMGIDGSILAMIVCITPAAIMIPIQFKLIVKGKAFGLFNI